MTDQAFLAVSPHSVRAFDEEYVPLLVGGPTTAERHTVGRAGVVMGPGGTVIVLDAHAAGDRSGVGNAERVRLVGPAPATVTERLMGTAWDGGRHVSPIHIAVRTGDEVLYLGTAHVSRAGASGGVLSDCELLLDTPLSRDLLDRVRPRSASAVLPDLTWLRAVNGDRAAALEQFLDGWYPATSGTERPSSSAPRLPESLRQLYRIAVRRPDVLGTQNRILPESDLFTDPPGETLVFGVENQGGFFWSLLWTTEDAESDPTVWFREYDEEPVAEQEPLSGFLLQFSLFEASLGADYLALPRRLGAAQVELFTQALHPVPLRPFWPGAPTHFYVAPGLVVHVSSEDGEEFDVWAGATQRSALDRWADLPVDWTRFDG
ncbi:hypothetical protein [Streptomyces lichenis]|uniref:Uncharacterized protein n=1 Tax=Streptomyces lichenis TaxID=2306967 RepID=A0ABT0IDJ9_9ACTN|nr:hypothetical protein [Streptomyces lichenis]MCK8679352.1 hypothetical protein [Streptomyces lichenis]